MKSTIKNVFFTIIITIPLISCKKEDKHILISDNDLHNAVQKITDIMIHDIFSPPVASRIYAYPNIAAYEIIAKYDNSYSSLAGQLPDLTPIPNKNTKSLVNPQLAALIAHMSLSKTLIFSGDKMEKYVDSLYTIWKRINKNEFEVSKEYGLQVANHIKLWMDTDNYKQTRTMQKFMVNSEDPSRWKPTPPAYMDGIEPHWSQIRSFTLDSAAQFKPIPPPLFSLDTTSHFYKELKEVYDISNKITKQGDDSEELAMAQFWDCNPYVSISRGHLMFATKKISPGAHWIGITKIASKKNKYDFNNTLFAYTKTSIAIFDAFISCWDEKYRSNLIRPETLINQYIDENWEPILQTPPFPEYVSGHSVVSGAASTVLTSIFGDDFSFDDDTELPYGLPVRSFSSFNKAADEAALSRLYGGIHYRAAIEIGLEQGRKLGDFTIEKLKMTNNNKAVLN